MNDKNVNIKKLHGFYLEELNVGMWDLFSKTITSADIVIYSGISGDTNPIHLDKNFAENTIFKEPISHGMLTASLISAVIGTKLPGPGSIYIKQSLQFKAPVKVGDTVTAIARIKNIIKTKGFVELKTICFIDDTVVIDGEATVLVPRKKN